ncbi:hypothetical protein CZ797_15170 [Pseudoalteromonas sp. JB197]|nr:hypothetical protein CZ797_15170 [Pseudoalteromonas sp. JB197]
MLTCFNKITLLTTLFWIIITQIKRQLVIAAFLFVHSHSF